MKARFKVFYSVFLLAAFTALCAVLFSSCGTCDHEYEDIEVLPVCDRITVYSKTCVKCAEAVKEYIPPTGHSYTRSTKEASCTSGGYTEFTCHCGFSFQSDIVSAKGHDYRDVVYSPTCVEEGYTLRVCRACDNTYKANTVKPTGHDLKADKTAPGCTEQGYVTYSCKSCNYSFVSDYCAPAGHSYVAEVTPPSCEDVGSTKYTCSACGDSYVGDYVSAKGHSYTAEKVDPTCSESGYTVNSCSDCDSSYVSDYTSPRGHEYTKAVVSEADCTNGGQISYTCECGDSYTEEVFPLGHSYETTVTLPTLSDYGFTEHTCIRCEEVSRGNYTLYSSIVENAYADVTEPIAKGIDVSVYNHKANAEGFLPLDWNAIKSEGVDYVILKAGSTLRENGTKGGIDATFNMDYNDAKAAGVGVGVYFYTYATNLDQIRTDAYMLLAMLEGKQLEYPVYLDLEDDSIRDLGAPMLNRMCFEFFTILQRAGYYTGLYVNHEWLYNVINTQSAIDTFDIWYARYPADSSTIWDTEEFGKPFGMWQYTDSGKLVCVEDTVFDMNYCYKDYPTIIKELGYNGFGSESKFPDDGKQFVWIKASYLTVRSSEDFDSSENVIAYAPYGSRFEVLEAADTYTKILYNGKEAYISANVKYVSFSPVWESLQ